MILLTLDVNVLISGLDANDRVDKQEAYEKLLTLQEAGLVDIGMTTRFEQDKAHDRDPVRAEYHQRERQRFANLPGPMRWGYSRWGYDVLVSETIMEELQRLFGIKDFASANKHTVWDVDHLYGHLTAGRDYFLTYETRILKRAKRLESLGIRVWDPRSLVNGAQIAEREAKTAAELDALLPAVLDKVFKGKL